MMNLYQTVVTAVICYKLFFVTILSSPTTSHHQQQYYVNGFELPGKYTLSNTTKNRLMMPLRLDNALLGGVRVGGTAPLPHRTTAAFASSNNEEADARPRGIVLNSAVGGLTFFGGLMGYVTKGSKPSLIAGSTFGGSLMLSAYLISKSSKSKSSTGNILGSIVAGILGYVMGKKFLVSKKFMPAGFLTFLSAVNVVYNLIEVNILFSRNSRAADNASSADAEKEDESSGSEEKEDNSSEISMS
ncbi:MAG: uncharacterized membrane protein (UPF0136 family) [Bacillariaceae sp.]|jgi:uncharacterized membrane protein (UPF0136 family)